ncbi:MAG: lipopolysaccharide biosynthesis protein [Bacteroidota bacterium]
MTFADLRHLVIRYVPGSVGPVLLALASTFIFTRVFEAEAYGRYVLAFTTAQLLAMLAGQWVQQAGVRYLSSRPDSTGPTRPMYALGVALIISLLALCTLGSVGVLWVLMAPADGVWWPYVIPALLAALGLTAFNILLAVLQSRRAARTHSAYRLVESMLKLSGAVLLVWIVFEHPASILWGAALSLGIVVPFLWCQVGLPGPNRSLRYVQHTTVRRFVRRFFVFGAPLAGWFLAANLLDSADRYMLQWLRGEAEVGIYAANYSLIGGGVRLLAAPLLLAAYPLLVEAWDRGRAEEASTWLTHITEGLLVIGGGAVAGLVLFSADLAGLVLGPDFREGHRVLPLVMAGVVFWQIGMYVHKPLEFALQTTTMLKAGLACAAINIALNAGFIPAFGYMGAALATLVSYLVYLLLVGWAARSMLPLVLPWGRLIKVGGVLIFGVSALVLLGERLGPDSDGVYLGLRILGFCVTFTIGLHLAGYSPLLRRYLVNRTSSRSPESDPTRQR